VEENPPDAGPAFLSVLVQEHDGWNALHLVFPQQSFVKRVAALVTSTLTMTKSLSPA